MSFCQGPRIKLLGFAAAGVFNCTYILPHTPFVYIYLRGRVSTGYYVRREPVVYRRVKGQVTSGIFINRYSGGAARLLFTCHVVC